MPLQKINWMSSCMNIISIKFRSRFSGILSSADMYTFVAFSDTRYVWSVLSELYKFSSVGWSVVMSPIIVCFPSKFY